MMQEAGLKNIKFRKGPPFWTAIGFKKYKCVELMVSIVCLYQILIMQFLK